MIFISVARCLLIYIIKFCIIVIKYSWLKKLMSFTCLISMTMHQLIVLGRPILIPLAVPLYKISVALITNIERRIALFYSQPTPLAFGLLVMKHQTPLYTTPSIHWESNLNKIDDYCCTRKCWWYTRNDITRKIWTLIW